MSPWTRSPGARLPYGSAPSSSLVAPASEAKPTSLTRPPGTESRTSATAAAATAASRTHPRDGVQDPALPDGPRRAQRDRRAPPRQVDERHARRDHAPLEVALVEQHDRHRDAANASASRFSMRRAAGAASRAGTRPASPRARRVLPHLAAEARVAVLVAVDGDDRPAVRYRGLEHHAPAVEEADAGGLVVERLVTMRSRTCRARCSPRGGIAQHRRVRSAPDGRATARCPCRYQPIAASTKGRPARHERRSTQRREARPVSGEGPPRVQDRQPR